MIATEPTLGVGQSNSALLFVLTGWASFVANRHAKNVSAYYELLLDCTHSVENADFPSLWEQYFFIFSGPVGPYYPTGFKPVSLLADPSFVRAWPGGSGNTKMGANYAPTLLVQKIAEQKFGCQQVWAGHEALFGERVVLMGRWFLYSSIPGSVAVWGRPSVNGSRNDECFHVLD